MILNKSFMQGFLYSKTDIGLYRLRNMSYEELLRECKLFIGFRHSLEDRQDFRQDPDWKLTLDEEIDLDDYGLVKEESKEANTQDSLWTSGNEVISCGCCKDCDCEKEISSTWEEEARKVLIKPNKYKDIRVYEDSVLSDIIDAVINYKGINGIVENLTETQILSITLDIIYNRKMKKYGGYVDIDDIEPAIECVNKMINIYGDGLIPVAYKKSPISEFSTKELFDELCTRGGVETHWIAPDTNYELKIKNSIETCHQDVIFKGNGPLWITFNYD